MTLEEFWATPEGPPDYEFEDGEVIAMVSPHGRHQELLLILGAELRAHNAKNKLGKIWLEIDVHLPSVQRVYIPDLVFLGAEHLDRYSKEDGKIHDLPDLVIEVLSPSTKWRDRTTKKNVYEQAGVTWYWMVDADDLTVEECKLTPDGYLIAQSIPPGQPFAPKLFPGLSLDLAELMGEEIQPEDAS